MEIASKNEPPEPPEEDGGAGGGASKDEVAGGPPPIIGGGGGPPIFGGGGGGTEPDLGGGGGPPVRGGGGGFAPGGLEAGGGGGGAEVGGGASSPPFCSITFITKAAVSLFLSSLFLIPAAWKSLRHSGGMFLIYKVYERMQWVISTSNPLSLFQPMLLSCLKLEGSEIIRGSSLSSFCPIKPLIFPTKFPKPKPVFF